MHDHLWNHPENHELEQADGEAEAGPIMPVFHNLKGIALKVYLSIKVHLMESLHRHLVLSIVFGSIRLLVETEVMLNGAPWVPDLLILPWRYTGSQ